MFLIVILMALFGQAAAQNNTDRVTDLTEQLKSQNANVRNRAALALGDMGPEAKQAIPALIEAFKDQNELCKQQTSVAKALGKMGPEKEAIPALIEALKDQDRFVRIGETHAI